MRDMFRPDEDGLATEVAVSTLQSGRARTDVDSRTINRGALSKGGLVVFFYDRPVEDEAESAKEGRPIFKPKTFVKILTPGDRDQIVDREAWLDKRNVASDISRFKDEYQDYVEGARRVVRGTPLASCTAFSREQVEEIKRLPGFEEAPVQTVEQLAQLADDVASRFHLVRLKQIAQDFLKASEGAAGMTSLRKENQDLRRQMDVQARQLEELAARLNSLTVGETPAPRPRARRKAAAARATA